MLLFEFFPAFVALVSIVAGVWLFMQNLEADREAEQSAPVDISATRPVDGSLRSKVTASSASASRRPYSSPTMLR